MFLMRNLFIFMKKGARKKVLQNRRALIPLFANQSNSDITCCAEEQEII